MIRNVAFEALPVSIPPHQYRMLRITWVTDVCILCGTKTSNMRAWQPSRPAPSNANLFAKQPRKDLEGSAD